MGCQRQEDGCSLLFTQQPCLPAPTLSCSSWHCPLASIHFLFFLLLQLCGKLQKGLCFVVQDHCSYSGRFCQLTHSLRHHVCTSLVVRFCFQMLDFGSLTSELTLGHQLLFLLKRKGVTQYQNRAGPTVVSSQEVSSTKQDCLPFYQEGRGLGAASAKDVPELGIVCSQTSSSQAGQCLADVIFRTPLHPFRSTIVLGGD